jgi:hypothetical protein
VGRAKREREREILSVVAIFHWNKNWKKYIKVQHDECFTGIMEEGSIAFNTVIKLSLGALLDRDFIFFQACSLVVTHVLMTRQ